MGTRGRFPSAIRLSNTALQYREDSTSEKYSTQTKVWQFNCDFSPGNQANSVGLNHLQRKARHQQEKYLQNDEAAMSGTNGLFVAAFFCP